MGVSHTPCDITEFYRIHWRCQRFFCHNVSISWLLCQEHCCNIAVTYCSLLWTELRTRAHRVSRGKIFDRVVSIFISLMFRPDSTMQVFVVEVCYSCTNESVLPSQHDNLPVPVSFFHLGGEEQCRLRVLLRDSTQWAQVTTLWSWVQFSNQCTMVIF